MSSFNKIDKIKYVQNASDVVSLSEYMILTDTTSEKKCIVFKFENNANQILFGLEFEVSQYDISNALIGKSIVVYNGFSAKENESFVPKAKFNADYDCASISIRLIKAHFDRVVWNEGEYSQNDRGSFGATRYTPETVKISSKSQRKRERNENKSKRHNGKAVSLFKVENITRKNIAHFPAVFYALICLLTIAFVAVSLYYFKGVSNKFTLQGYDLRLLDKSNMTVAIYGCEPESVDLVIPDNIEGYTVVKIEAGAFANSKIHSVKCNADLIVEEGAFKDCYALESIDMPNAFLQSDSFARCDIVQFMSFNQTDADKLSSIFGAGIHTVKVSVSLDMTYLPEDFFDGMIVDIM